MSLGKRERGHALFQSVRQALREDPRHLGVGVARAEVGQQDGFVLEPIGASDHFIEVHVPTRARLVHARALVEESALEDQEARGTHARMGVEPLDARVAAEGDLGRLGRRLQVRSVPGHARQLVLRDAAEARIEARAALP